MSFLDVVPKMKESQWAGQVDTLARMFGWRWWHDNATNAPRRCPRCKEIIKLPRNTPGWPDRLLLRDDTLIVAELKKEGEYPTREQREWLDAFRNVRRVAVVVWRPRDAQEVADMLGGNHGS